MFVNSTTESYRTNYNESSFNNSSSILCLDRHFEKQTNCIYLTAVALSTYIQYIFYNVNIFKARSMIIYTYYIVCATVQLYAQ